MSYFAVLTLFVLALFGSLVFVVRLSKIERGPRLFALLCLLPTTFMFLVGLVALNLPIEGATEITVHNIDKVPDAGPVSFARAAAFGFVPGAAYFSLSSVGYVLSGFIIRK